uniref:Uncharacterized protein n=1 Tax=Micrurus surinamensis TaxID=129470 RepID=A0A2D4P2A7_MICSU
MLQMIIHQSYPTHKQTIWVEKHNSKINVFLGNHHIKIQNRPAAILDTFNVNILLGNIFRPFTRSSAAFFTGQYKLKTYTSAKISLGSILLSYSPSMNILSLL